MTGDPLAVIDAALDQRCGHCGERIPPSSPSAYFCDDEHQLAWTREQATDVASVEHSEDPTYRYPHGPMRWVPGLVSDEPDADLETVTDVPEVLRYGGGLRLNPTIYRRRGTVVWHLRLDDGYRYAGRDLDDGLADTAPRVWASLERELRNPSRVEPIERYLPQQSERVWLYPLAGEVQPRVHLRPGLTGLDSQAGGGLRSPSEAVWREHWRGTSAGEYWPTNRRCPWCLRYGPARPGQYGTPIFGDRITRTSDSRWWCGGCRSRLPDLEIEVTTNPDTLVYVYRLTLIDGPERATAGIPLTPADVDGVHPGKVLAYLESIAVARLARRTHRAANLLQAAWPEVRQLLLTGHPDPIAEAQERLSYPRRAWLA